MHGLKGNNKALLFQRSIHRGALNARRCKRWEWTPIGAKREIGVISSLSERQERGWTRNAEDWIAEKECGLRDRSWEE